MIDNYLVLGGIIVDDLIYDNGNTSMGVVGGGGLYAAVGARIWTEEVFMVARVGANFDVEVVDSYGLSSEYIEETSLPTPRAWQILDAQHERTQIPRVSTTEWYAQLIIDESNLPDEKLFTGLHILGRGFESEARIIERYMRKGTIISYEPVVSEHTNKKHLDVIVSCLEMVNIFSPDLLACEVIGNLRDPIQAGRWFADHGVKNVVVRMGKQGALLVQTDNDNVWQIPSCANEIVNTVGAGNAFCGGFLVGWCSSNGDVRYAGSSASISAAITMENIGSPMVTPELSKRAFGLRNEFMNKVVKQ